jgi:hypothetical protein
VCAAGLWREDQRGVTTTTKRSEKGRKTEEKTNKTKTEKNRVKRMHMPRSTTNKRVQNDGETPR